MQEADAVAQIVDAVHAVFDADPAIETCLREFAKDCVEVVEPAADYAVAESLGVADGVFFAAKIFECSFGEVAVAGMHRYQPMLHASQKFERIIASEDRVAWVVVYAEIRRLDALHKLAEVGYLLRELGMGPIVVFVVIFDHECYATGG